MTKVLRLKDVGRRLGVVEERVEALEELDPGEPTREEVDTAVGAAINQDIGPHFKTIHRELEELRWRIAILADVVGTTPKLRRILRRKLEEGKAP